MLTRELFAANWTSEVKAFRKVLEAMPGDKLDYTPHERSRNARDLAWTIVSEANNIANILETGDIDEKDENSPATKEEIISGFDRAVASIESKLKTVTEERWNGIGKFIITGRVVAQMPSSQLAWIMHQDLVHHRGQLSVYLRPMGGKVPAIYGPSGDDNSGM